MEVIYNHSGTSRVAWGICGKILEQRTINAERTARGGQGARR